MKIIHHSVVFFFVQMFMPARMGLCSGNRGSGYRAWSGGTVQMFSGNLANGRRVYGEGLGFVGGMDRGNWGNGMGMGLCELAGWQGG